MSDKIIKKLPDLRRRVGRFLRSSTYGRDEIGVLLRALATAGDGAIIGGMLRDIALEGDEEFHSDVDVVIACDDSGAIESVLCSQRFPWTRNKFGGYRVSLTKWKVDVWALKATWALREGLVTGSRFEDLPATTFFDWDAIVYILGTGHIVATDGYLDKLRGRKLGVNLKANPNPVGNAVRALRYAAKYEARFSNSLAEYVGEVLARYSPKEICELERRSHETPLLMQTDIESLMEPLRAPGGRLALSDSFNRRRQYELWPRYDAMTKR